MAEKPMSDDIINELTKKMLSYFRTKDTNKKNANKRIVKKSKSNKDVLALRQSRQAAKDKVVKESAAKSRIALRAKKEKYDLDQAYKRSAVADKNKKMSKLPKKRPKSITAMSVIKKDTNLKTDKAPKKKVIVTKEQLKKSGLSLRDYMNMLQGKTRRDYKDVKKAAVKKRAKGAIT